MGNQLRWRLSDICGYLSFTGGGFVVGWLVSKPVWEVAVDVLYGYTGDIDEIWDYYYLWNARGRIIFGLFFGLYCSNTGQKTHNLYNDLVGLKREHMLTWYELRHLNPVLFNPIADMLWSFGYTASEDFLIPIVAVSSTVTAFMLLLKHSIWVAGVGAFINFFVISDVASVVVYKLFSRFDLTREIQEAALIIQAMRIAEQEQRMAEEKRRFYERDQDHLPPPYDL